MENPLHTGVKKQTSSSKGVDKNVRNRHEQQCHQNALYIDNHDYISLFSIDSAEVKSYEAHKLRNGDGLN